MGDTPEVSILKSRSYSHVPLADVQGTLNGNATILEYVLADPVSWCLVIRRDSANIVRLRGKQQVESVVSSYLKALKEKQLDQAAARDLYAALLQPVRHEGQSADLMIVRDGLLNLLLAPI